MARSGITKEQVYEAAGALLEEGTVPTVQSVRERIGSGSYSTVSSHLAQWRQEHGQVPANIPEMPEKVLGVFHQAWATAIRTAQDHVETQREALEAMRREMNQEKAHFSLLVLLLEVLQSF